MHPALRPATANTARRPVALRAQQPRPEQVAFVEAFERAIPRYASRHVVRPGITGLAQVEQGYVDDEDGTRTKLIYDLHYIDHLSFKLDMEIVGKTIYTMATGFGAR